MKTKNLVHLELRDLILLGIIIAMKVILAQFSFGPAMVKVGLGFIGSVMLGYILALSGEVLVVESAI